MKFLLLLIPILITPVVDYNKKNIPQKKLRNAPPEKLNLNITPPQIRCKASYPNIYCKALPRKHFAGNIRNWYYVKNVDLAYPAGKESSLRFIQTGPEVSIPIKNFKKKKWHGIVMHTEINGYTFIGLIVFKVDHKIEKIWFLRNPPGWYENREMTEEKISHNILPVEPTSSGAISTLWTFSLTRLARLISWIPLAA